MIGQFAGHAAIAAVGMSMVALAAAAESVLAMAARVSLRELAGRGVWRDQAMERLVADPLRTWATLTVLYTGGLMAAGAGGVLLVQGLGASVATGIALLGAYAAAVVLLAYLGPRLVASRNAEITAFVVATPLHLAALALFPAVAPLAALARRLRHEGVIDLAGGSVLMRADDMRVLVNGGDDDGLLEEDEREMIAGIFELSATKVREVMVPRIDIVAMPVDASLDEALDTIIAAGHSRIPVYRESIDDIAGILYAKDLLRAFRDRNFKPDLRSRLREAYFVPESKPVDELLTDLQARKVHMAIIVDEYGGTAGVVTIEDLIEEIVGEIQDEYDVEEARIELLSEDEGIFHAGVDIDDVNRLMGIELPTDDVDTLAGLVFTGLGKVPDVGDTADFPDATIEVLDVTDRRIQRVRVTRRPQGQAPEIAPSSHEAEADAGAAAATGAVPASTEPG